MVHVESFSLFSLFKEFQNIYDIFFRRLLNLVSYTSVSAVFKHCSLYVCCVLWVLPTMFNEHVSFFYVRVIPDITLNLIKSLIRSFLLDIVIKKQIKI